MSDEQKIRKLRMKMAIERANGHGVFRLPCGTIGSARDLFSIAVHMGFDGPYTTFYDRVRNADGKKTMAELASPVAASRSFRRGKKRVQSQDVADAIAALDARKAAMR